MSIGSPELSDAQVRDVLSRIPIPWIKEHHQTYYAERTPLHVDFGVGPDLEPAIPLEDAVGLKDPNRFNAVGSLAITDLPDTLKQEVHLPVIDADGGAKIGERKPGFKAVVYSPARKKEYGPNSLLRDVLGDNGIDLEVFETPDETSIHGRVVRALVLRASQNIFDARSSSQDGHDHLYIGRAFNGPDHEALIRGLGATGIISQRWMELVLTRGMGVVRTPWTKKKVTYHTDS